MFEEGEVVEVYGDKGTIIFVSFCEEEQEYEYEIEFFDGECEWYWAWDIDYPKINKKQKKLAW